MSDTAPEKLAGYFLEWQVIEDEKAKLSERSKDLSKAMKAEGYDTKAARTSFREKHFELDATADEVAKAEEADAVLDLYRTALTNGLAARARPAHAHEKRLKNSASPELTDTQEQPEKPAAQFQAKASEDNGSITGGAGAVAGEASRLASGRTDAGEAASTDLPIHSPSPELPQAIADDEATPPAQSSAPIPSAADLLPGAVKAPEAGSSPASGAVLPQSEIPAFLRKSAADYRPNCQHPDACGSSNPTGHCYTCTRAMEAAESEAA